MPQPPTNIHIHLRVRDLEESRRFYQRFLGAPPVKERPGYLKFLPDFAPLNLALSTGLGERGSTVDHLGVQVESRAVVDRLLGQAKAAGLAVREEMGTDCCHANQDKFWVRDPDGVEWEIYVLNYDLDEDAPGAAASASTCCAPAPLATLRRRSGASP